MSWYEHILICWENGTVIGYSDVDKIREIALRYVNMYREYERKYDELVIKEKQSKSQSTELLTEYYKNLNELGDLLISETSINILENISTGKSYFEGNKGGLWICGCIANYTTVCMVLDELGNFFKELIDKKHLYGNIIGFGESEQSGRCEIYIFDKDKSEGRKIEDGEIWNWGLLS